MIFTETKLKGAFILDLERHEGSRGFFARAFCQNEFRAHGLKPAAPGQRTVQHPQGHRARHALPGSPAAEAKLVRCARGAVIDIIVDLRSTSRSSWTRTTSAPSSSPSASHTAIRHSPTRPRRATWWASSTAHRASGLRYDDLKLGLSWPLPVTVVSEKDQNVPLFETWSDRLGHEMTLT